MATGKTATVNDWSDVSDWQDVNDWQDTAPGVSKPPVTGKRMSKEEASKYVRPLPKGAEEQSWGLNPVNALKGALGTAWGAVKGGMEMGVAALEADPTPFVNAGKAVVDQYGKAKAAAAKGRYSEAAGHAGGMVPLIGPSAVHAGERMAGAPEMPPLQRLDTDPQSASQATPPDVMGGGGEAAALVGMSSPAAMRGVAKGAGATGAAALKVARPLEQPLRESALRSYERALGATKERNKFSAQEKVAPGLIDRGVVVATRKGLQQKATAHVNSLGAAIDEAWRSLPEGEALPTKPIQDALSNYASKEFMMAENGKSVPMGTQGNIGVQRTRVLQRSIDAASKPDPITGEKVISTENLLKLRRFSDKIASRAGSYDGKSLADQSTAAIHEELANAARSELAKSHPDIAKLNAEFSFWKSTKQVIDDTLLRTGPQAKPLGEMIAGAAGGTAGYMSHGIPGGVLFGVAVPTLIKFMRSPAWQTTSAVAKSKIADLIAAQKPAEAEVVVRGLLEAPTRKMPPVADTSGPIGPSSGPIPSLGHDVGARTLPAPSRVQSGGFAVEDMVPIRNAEGNIEYVAPWTLQKTKYPLRTQPEPSPISRLDKEASAAPRSLARPDDLPAAIREEFARTEGWGRSVPASLPQIKKALADRGFSPQQIDKEVVRMADSGEINLVTHDHGPALSAEEQAGLVHDPTTKDYHGRPAYYVAATKR